ncbi:MAG: phosphodiester glycosidase family protein [Bacteriovoracaceae bacterium]|nr:phosphodiester glycosidase family protein [Bacteriovoracaceae bacterium]
MSVAKKSRGALDPLISLFKKEKVETWFDIGLFLDRIKDNRQEFNLPSTFKKFKTSIKSGVAFITFDFGIDGVTMEIAKYGRALERIYQSPGDKSKHKINIHCLGGIFFKEADTILPEHWEKKLIEKMAGFGEWDGYKEYFHTHLNRGSAEYNQLAKKVWNQAVIISLELGEYIVDNDIKLLIPVNINANPGNVSLAMSLAIVSEFMDIPVLASHHDCYWEDGKRKRDRIKMSERTGLRDHFFLNTHLGEVFSPIEVLYPWEGKRWFHTTINALQKKSLVKKYGFNQLSIGHMPTSIKMSKYRPVNINEIEDILKRLHLVLSEGQKQLISQDAFKIDISGHCYKSNEERAPLVIGHQAGLKINLRRGNLLFVQPTRILSRKSIETNFLFIDLLLRNRKFFNFFNSNPNLTITILITGPVASGHELYFERLLDDFKKMLEGTIEEFKDRIFLACTFCIDNKEVLKKMSLKDLEVNEIYSVASLILLPSKTEGRGLPIIESCSAGVPIICNRYAPEHVYADVIGEMLEESKRFRVFEFANEEFNEDFLDRVAEIFIDPRSLKDLILRNMEVVKKRYSNKILVKSFEHFLQKLWLRSKEDTVVEANVKAAFRLHNKRTKYDEQFSKVVLSENRKYIPGLTITEFMIYLKSLIDPSYFRLEEMEFRGRMMAFSESLVRMYYRRKKVDEEQRSFFLKHVDYIFEYYSGKDKLAIDHSLSYRHRHRRKYPFRKLTEQELCGIIGIIFRDVFDPTFPPHLKTRTLGHFNSLKGSIMQLIGSTKEKLAIDSSARLLDDLRSNKEIALFVGHHFKAEINIFVLNVLRERLGISFDQELSEEILQKRSLDGIGKVSVFVRKEPLNDISAEFLLEWLEKDAFLEIKRLYECGLFEIVETSILASGIHLGQLGKPALKALEKIKNNGGIVIASGENSFMVDMIDLSSYRFGKVNNELMANFMGINLGESYIQWVPAGLKPSLAYPTPIQTPKEFSEVIESDLFKECVDKLGEDEVLKVLRDDADKFGNPIKDELEKLVASNLDPAHDHNSLKFTQINGMYDDQLPWSGALAEVHLNGESWKFVTAFSGKVAKTVLELVDNYQQKSNEVVSFAWNGGYILNNELVGKLGLGEEYIGSPLGYLCIDGKVISLPLYNKATFLIDKEGQITIERVNLKNGLKIKFGASCLEMSSKQRNKASSQDPIYYDLLFAQETIAAKDRIIYRFVGNIVSEIITDVSQPVEIIPVGLTVSCPKTKALKGIKVGSEVEYELPGLEHIKDAIEAGPLLVKSSKVSIDMEIEGWKTEHSISTQAARLDFLDMRGPKMGVGITRDNRLILIAINGRIRESVGATHIDLANILKSFGAYSAMGFDPGGSVTLVVHGKQLNISPYNKDYEDNVYSLPPTPRMVGNAILGINAR